MAKVMFSSGSRSWANNLNDLRQRWNIRREEPIRFVVPVALFKKDIRKLDRPDLLDLKTNLIKLLNDGKQELLRHQNIKRKEGVYLEADKYSDLFYTIKAIDTHIQAVNHALSKIKQQNNSTLVMHFMDICKERLPQETWHEFMNEAHARINAPNTACTNDQG